MHSIYFNVFFKTVNEFTIFSCLSQITALIALIIHKKPLIFTDCQQKVANIL